MKDNMLEIIHNNANRENTKYRINKMLKEDRKRINKDKEHKEELSENRAMVMVAISLVLIAFKIIGLV